MWDIGNKSNWRKVLSSTYYAQVSQSDSKSFIPIPSIIATVNSYTLLIGAQSMQAKSHWYLAGHACPRLLFTPSSDSDFLSLVQSSSGTKIGLNRLNLISFSNYELLPYILEISIAKWHKDISIEIWEYTGVVPNAIDELVEIKSDLDRIETKIDSSAM